MTEEEKYKDLFESTEELEYQADCKFRGIIEELKFRTDCVSRHDKEIEDHECRISALELKIAEQGVIINNQKETIKKLVDTLNQTAYIVEKISKEIDDPASIIYKQPEEDLIDKMVESEYNNTFGKPREELKFKRDPVFKYDSSKNSFGEPM